MAVIVTSDHCVYAFDSILNHLSSGEQPLRRPAFEDLVCPLFVTWNKAVGHSEPRLRGCIGTFEPRTLHHAVKEYALISALRDRRFDPISLSELPHLRCTVSLLHSFEPGAAWDDWEVGRHGITIEFIDPATGSRRTATFLPEVAAHERWDKEETLEHLVRKAGCGARAATVRRSLKLTRYQTATYTLAYEEYEQLKDPQRFRRVSAAEEEKESLATEEGITVPA